MRYLGISKNSKQIKPGFIYACFAGQQVSGYDYIDSAVKNGAVKIIGENEYNHPLYEQVKDVNQAMINYAQNIYQNPHKKIKLIGITGTDGKTSTALILHTLLNKFSKSAYLGTNGFFINDQKIAYNGFTTPYADELYDYLNQSIQAGCQYFVMEVSSHALAQKRILGLEFDYAVFTNLSEEHLDFHHNIEEYFDAKKELFKMLKLGGQAIINTDDRYGFMLYNELQYYQKIHINTLGKNKSKNKLTYQIKNIKLSTRKTTFELQGKINLLITSPLLAEFNIYNLSQALIVLDKEKFPIIKNLSLLDDLVIPGRLEVITKPHYPQIIIDFAHTPEAINKILNFISKTSDFDKIWVVTGSAGQRDQIKRPKMGEVISRYADYLILTEDDPRNESVKQINLDLQKNIQPNSIVVKEILKRSDAIKYTIEHAQVNDLIILFGKGSMEYMYYDNYKQKYSEKEEVLKNLK